MIYFETSRPYLGTLKHSKQFSKNTGCLFFIDHLNLKWLSLHIVFMVKFFITDNWRCRFSSIWLLITRIKFDPKETTKTPLLESLINHCKLNSDGHTIVCSCEKTDHVWVAPALWGFRIKHRRSYGFWYTCEQYSLYLEPRTAVICSLPDLPMNQQRRCFILDWSGGRVQLQDIPSSPDNVILP